MAFLNHPATCDCPVCKNYQPYQPAEPAGKDWQAEYEFWNKIIGDEVARLRFNDGFEPVDCDLYKSGRRWIGRTRICHRDFRVIASEAFDPQGKAILKLSIRAIRR